MIITIENLHIEDTG